jgi:transposase-like protein
LRGWGHAKTESVFSGGTGASGADGPGPGRGARVAVAITSIAEKIGWHMETLRNWVRQAERDQGTRQALTTKERQRLKQLERDNFELRRANDTAPGIGIFREAGGRPPTHVMVGFIDDHREKFGVEPICAVLPIAPSVYYERRARCRDPNRRPPRVRRDDELGCSDALVFT